MGSRIEMGKWKDAFQHGRPSSWDREYGREYEFGPPATDQQLAALEQQLGSPLPADLREMLREFNGVQYTIKIDREQGYGPSKLLLTTEQIAGVLELLLDTGNDLPPVEQLKQVAFIWQ